jgi:hypothetical protein
VESSSPLSFMIRATHLTPLPCGSYELVLRLTPFRKTAIPDESPASAEPASSKGNFAKKRREGSRA